MLCTSEIAGNYFDVSTIHHLFWAWQMSCHPLIKKKLVPKGTSEYQATWYSDEGMDIDISDTENIDDNGTNFSMNENNM